MARPRKPPQPRAVARSLAGQARNVAPSRRPASSPPAPGKPAARAAAPNPPAPGKPAARSTPKKPSKPAPPQKPGNPAPTQKAKKPATPQKPEAPTPSRRKATRPAPSSRKAREPAPPQKKAASPPRKAAPPTGKAASPPRKAAPPTGEASSSPPRKAREPAPPHRTPAPAGLSGGSSVVKVLDSREPIEALRTFLAQIPGEATREQGQIVLGSAQLMLLPIAHEHRGGDEVKQLLDLVLARWDAFPDRAGFHAQEFLRNAFAAVGDDRDRIAQLAMRVPPDATSELRFNMAGAYAVCGDRPAMLRALEAALATGATAAQVRRDPDLARFLDDPAMLALLDRAAVPAIPVDVEPHVAPVRAALDALIGTLRELGEHSRLNPPATVEAVLAAERARQIQLPNDYRALLTLTDGMAAWDHEFLGTLDYRADTQLSRRARAFLEMSASYGGIGMDECVPLASWGRPNHWLLYDPRGAVREGAPGYVVMLTADPWPMNDLADALGKIEESVRDALGTN
ncbi:MAG TPA: SMI1/KNR4 family protein [Kofleriaceae bacterium]|nr:SMI1/KNR4 family protein [Kofleriaceae bacterium]